MLGFAGRAAFLRHLHELLEQHGPRIDVDEPMLGGRLPCRLRLGRNAAGASRSTLARAASGGRSLGCHRGALHAAGRRHRSLLASRAASDGRSVVPSSPSLFTRTRCVMPAASSWRIMAMTREPFRSGLAIAAFSNSLY